MNNTKNSTGKFFSLEKILGFILLIPPVVSVPLFFINLASKESGAVAQMSNLSAFWSGSYSWGGDGGGGGFTSATPVYLGLMAIAGAMLIRNGNKA